MNKASVKKFLKKKTFGIENWILGAGLLVLVVYLRRTSLARSAAAQVIKTSNRQTSTGDTRQTWSSPVPVPAGLVAAGAFAGGNTTESGPIGNTGLIHGPATVVPLLNKSQGLMGIDGKPAQNGYYLASKIWNKETFCGATSLQHARNKVSLAVARYIAAKLQHPINYFETPQFIAGVQAAYPSYVSQIASHLFPNCNLKVWSAGQIISDHTQNDGIFDPTKQIADDMLHYGCLGQPGLQEYGNEALQGDPTDCRGESAVGPTSPYHTS